MMEQFLQGCNYWASHAGIYMWRDWDAETVEKDLAFLSRYGLGTLRVFPLWSDFQPIELQLGAAPESEIRLFDRPLPNAGAGKYGVDETMLDRFGILTDIAAKYGFKLIVPLITGWMSGRLFVPPALLHKNPLTDAASMLWQRRFVKCFVNEFNSRENIIAWELGNECNCLGGADQAQAAVWAGLICDSVRSVDQTRPVYAGMHGLTCENVWTFNTLSENCDVMTTHPYPLFTPHCCREPLNSMRAALHCAAESAYYSGMTGKPCLVEEAGTLGPMFMSDKYTDEYAVKAALSARAYGAVGFLWWCAFNQRHLDYFPYDKICIERELGLAYDNQTPKPVLTAMRKINGLTEKLGRLSAPDYNAVCILSNSQPQWDVAYGAFAMAAQASRNIRFVYETDALADCGFYILPCVKGVKGLPKRLSSQLIERVQNGASLYISYDGGVIDEFEKLTGLKVKGYIRHSDTVEFTNGQATLKIERSSHLELIPDCAEVLIESGRQCVLSANLLGNGAVYFLNASLETAYTNSYAPHLSGLYSIYGRLLPKPVVSLSNPLCTITFHNTPNGRLAICADYSDNASKCLIKDLQPGYGIGKPVIGSLNGDLLSFQDGIAAFYIEGGQNISTESKQ
jgi:hypothetical protein